MNVKNLVLGIGIFIVYLLVLHFGIKAFSQGPQYEDFCTGRNSYYPGEYPIKVVDSTINCTLSPTPQQQDQCNVQGGYLVAESYDANGCPATFMCDMCNKEYTEAQKDHSKKVFIIALIAGILTLLVGYLILSMEPVGSALMASGIGALVYGSMNNWENLSGVWRFVLLLVALVLLIWITIQLNRNAGKKGIWQKLGLKK